MPEGADNLTKRYNYLLRIAVIPKAQYVIPQAIAKLRADEAKTGQEQDLARQNSLMDFLVFLSGSRDRSTLFGQLEEEP